MAIKEPTPETLRCLGLYRPRSHLNKADRVPPGSQGEDRVPQVLRVRTEEKMNSKSSLLQTPEQLLHSVPRKEVTSFLYSTYGTDSLRVR